MRKAYRSDVEEMVQEILWFQGRDIDPEDVVMALLDNAPLAEWTVVRGQATHPTITPEQFRLIVEAFED